MSKRTITACFITAFVVFALAFDGNVAQSKSKDGENLSVGVVSIKRLFDESKKNSAFSKELDSQQEKVLAELERARADIEAERAGLRTLKPGSSEYMAQMKKLMEKQARLGAEQEFQKQQFAIKNRQWIEQMYTSIIQAAKEVAEKRGLDLVLENSQIELSDVPDDTLVMSILMRTAVYAEGCVDITEEVMAKLDADK